MTLEVKKISCTRSHRELFSGIDFCLNSGEVVLIEGKNGSGKSTLLKVLSGLRKPDKGKVFWCGKPLASNGIEYSKQMAWVSHHNGVKESMTAKENLKLFAALSQVEATNIDELLCKVGLKGYGNRPVHQFSAGMKRRLSLSRLLMKQAKLWILDEPQASLDKEGIALFEKLADKHLSQGGMIAMSSHHDIQFEQHPVLKLKLLT
jgi:heme exporter protein A